MKFYSTANKQYTKGFKDAVIEGLAPERGLFFPQEIVPLPTSFLHNLSGYSLPEIGYEVMKPYVKEDINERDFRTLIEDVLNFDIPLHHVSDDVYSLELYHGPTLAFKDVGARFMSRCLSYFSDEKVKILVATSGDTGSAVANGFYKVPGVEVVILYPGNKISDIQEQQLTTLGHNITALEVDGTFDDCQELVKKAFLDETLKGKMNLSSANSINIARWLPQSIYYYWILSQVKEKSAPVSVSVPSGNFGNITAGIFAKKSGLAIDEFIAATNANDIIPSYLASGNYHAKPSVETIANAMDVGDPSNFLRLLELYNHDFTAMKKELVGFSMDDDKTRKVIDEVYKAHNYLLDPHGAIGYQALKEKAKEKNIKVFLETAHPVKFRDVVEPIIDNKLAVPERLEVCLKGRKEVVEMGVDYERFRAYLLS